MSDNISNNQKRIAKNTVHLSLRMLITMGISLYTSRAVLQNLGVIDYGVYNIVGGVVAMLNVVINSLSGATSRFLTYDLGLNNKEKLKQTFGNILSIHILLSLVIIIVGETLGLWFVYNELQIPEERLSAAIWCYHFSICAAVLTIISAPYNSAIIAHERMSAFAYISIMDALLKLGIAIVIAYSPFDRLILYGFLYLCMQLLDRIIFGIYCSRYFEEVHTNPTFDKGQFKQLFSFSGWLLIGCLAGVANNQGINILLNMFFGPIVNAARGIAFQVQGVVQSFCKNFQMAINPQLTKSYAANDLQTIQRLISLSSKFSTFILLVLGIPIFLEIRILLEWWLVEVPEPTVDFVRIGLILGIFAAINNPIINGILATGDIRKFQLVEGMCQLTIIPTSYIALEYYHCSPNFILILGLFIEAITQIVRLYLVLPKLQFPLFIYIRDIIIPITKVILISPIIPICAFVLLNNNSITEFVLIFAISTISVIISSAFLGCSKKERFTIIRMIKEKIHH